MRRASFESPYRLLARGARRGGRRLFQSLPSKQVWLLAERAAGALETAHCATTHRLALAPCIRSLSNFFDPVYRPCAVPSAARGRRGRVDATVVCAACGCGGRQSACRNGCSMCGYGGHV